MKESLSYPNTNRRRIGKLGTVGLAVSLGLGAVGCSTEPVKLPTVQAETRTLEFNRVTLPELGIGLETQKGLDVSGTSLDPDNVKNSIASVLDFASNAPVQSVFIGDGDNFVKFDVNLSYLSDINHEIVITQSSEISGRLAQADISHDAFTVMSPDLGARFSYISPVGPNEGRFNIPIDINQYNLSVELCNNFIGIEPIPGAEDALNELFPEKLKDGDLTWQLIGNEVVCNSYALAVSSKKAGVNYKDYAKTAEVQVLQSFPSRGFIVPYIVLTKEVWETL